MLTIPEDLGRWHPNDVTAWARQIADDNTVTDTEAAQADATITAALIGQLPQICGSRTTLRDAPRIIAMIAARPGWVATVYYSEVDEDGRGTVIGSERHRVIGWALTDADGTTDIEAVYIELPGFPTCASLHNSSTSDRVMVYAHFDPDAAALDDIPPTN